ncbi:hypothetical protein FA95DRAFT_1030082 [Auriscalpium vulgare]|uniref:Uncharacterized protein n=1 Tax=Auriscalpium vulgare TaxID=40419 RepID=A0ACB8R5U4_9AGAM|nr:hypothetical protein FA95DRAFT_1030082 [Auriscalpium vulgare]
MLWIYRELYIPLINFDTLDTSGLLNPSAGVGAAAWRQCEAQTHRGIENELFLCHNTAFAFYIIIHRSGRRFWSISCSPDQAHRRAMHTNIPVLAFEPNFLTTRNVEARLMSQIVQGHNLPCLTNIPRPPGGHHPSPMAHPRRHTASTSIRIRISTNINRSRPTSIAGIELRLDRALVMLILRADRESLHLVAEGVLPRECL